MNKMCKFVSSMGPTGKKHIIYYGFLKLNFYLKTTQGDESDHLSHTALSRISSGAALYCFLHFRNGNLSRIQQLHIRINDLARPLITER